MKNSIRFTVLPLLLLVVFTAVAQDTKEDNTKKGYMAEGYDVVAYFDGKAVEGSKSYMTTHGGTSYKFSSKPNLEKFKADPTKYAPQYGGWCAYAMAKDGDKVDINPETFEIRDGKLYLFYNAFFINTLDKWLEEDPKDLQKKADVEWNKKK